MVTELKQIRILAVDGHPLLREGIAAIIATQPDLKLVAPAASGEGAVDQFRLTRPDITLMDLQMPGMTGLHAIITIRKEYPTARIIVLTTYAGDVLAQRALKAGGHADILQILVCKEHVEDIRSEHHE